MAQTLHSEFHRGDIGVCVLLKGLWHARLSIVVTVAVFAAAGVAYALLAREWFESEVVLVPVESRSLASGLGQLGGLASLAGINLDAGSASQTPIAVLKSRDFAREFIEQKRLVEILLEEDSIDVVSGAAGLAASAAQPDVRDAVKVFDESVRRVIDDKKTGLVTVSIRWNDPVLAADWANALVASLNDKLRTQALAETERNIKYLQSEMAVTNITTLQQSIGRVLESEMQKSLMARSGGEYAFKVIDRATPAKFRSSPKRVQIVLGSLFFGFFLSSMFVLGRLWLVSDRGSAV